MDSTVFESVAPAASNDITGHARGSADTRERPGRPSWAGLYAVLLATVGLCLGGIRLAATIGHTTLLQSAVALAILGLLAAWIWRSRSALSGEPCRRRTCPGRPFSVIRLTFPPKSSELMVGVRPGAEAPRR